MLDSQMYAVQLRVVYVCTMQRMIVHYVLKMPIDIRDVQGMRTDTQHQGRAEYAPFPGGFSIASGLVSNSRHEPVVNYG